MAAEGIDSQEIDNYIVGFPPDVRQKLTELRQAIREMAPTASETINYGIPTFTLEGNLVHFAAFKGHIGFYPTPGGIEKFKNELSVYPSAKGSVQFPLDRPLPLDLVREIVAFRVNDNLAKAEAKKSRKKRSG